MPDEKPDETPGAEIIEAGSVPAAEVALPPGVQPSRNYQAAVELGHVLAASGYYTDARDPAKAAVKVMIGMDLGLSPTAALQGIHAFEEQGRMVFVIEAKLLSAVIKSRSGYDYRIVGERTEERVEVEFLREGEPQEPSIVWTKQDAQRAGLLNKDNWKKYPREMLTWRALAEGVRLHFPELLAGNPIYADAEFGVESEDLRLRETLAPPKAEPLTDEKAEELRARARAVYDELREINRDRMPPARFDASIRGAEHSHSRLEAVVVSLEDLRDSEKRIAELLDEYSQLASDSDVKALRSRAERKGSNRERIDLLEEQVAVAREPDGAGEAADTPSPGEEPDESP